MTAVLQELLQQRKLPEIPSDREAILEILQREIYGFLPPPPDEESFEEVRVIEDRYLEVSVKQMRATVRIGERSFSFPFITALHRDGKKRPFFIHNNFRPNFPDLYMPAEEIFDDGFDLISFCYTDVTSDDDDFTNGLADLLVGSAPREATTCGKIAIWAWAAMRLMDYAQTLPMLDHENGAIIGHSRLGKTAFVTAMFDTRFKFACSNNGGCCGDALTRGKVGETIALITGPVAYWFCDNLLKYVDRHDAMPFDQHFLLASLAPRYACTGSSSFDEWADPESQYLNCVAASDYFESKGVPGFICPDRLPNVPEAFLDGHIGFHIKKGEHFFSRHDWHRYMEFVKKHLDD